MSSRPSTVPQLDTNQTNRTIPAPSKVTDGYVLNDLLPSANANYLWGWAGDWLTWLDERTEDGTTPTIDFTLRARDALTATSVGGTTTIKGGDGGGTSGDGGDVVLLPGDVTSGNYGQVLLATSAGLAAYPHVEVNGTAYNNRTDMLLFSNNNSASYSEVGFASYNAGSEYSSWFVGARGYQNSVNPGRFFVLHYKNIAGSTVDVTALEFDDNEDATFSGTIDSDTVTAVAGTATANGVTGTGNTTGIGVYGTGGASNGTGVYGVGGAGNARGVHGQGTGNQVGVYGVGGPTNGTGIYGIGGTGNSRGVQGDGTGTGPGVYGAGGSSNGYGCHGVGNGSGAGIYGLGGGTNAAGVLGQGGATNGPGVQGTGAGTGYGVYGTGGGSSGIGVYGLGGASNGIGVKGQGDGSGYGVHGVGGDSSGQGVRGDGGSSNGIGVYGVGSGTGDGVYGIGGSSDGKGVYGQAGTIDVGTPIGVHGYSSQGSTTYGVKGEGAAATVGVYGISGTGYGIIAETDTTSPAKSALRLVPQDSDPSSGVQGDLYVNSGDGTLRVYNGSAWVKVGTQT